MFKKSRLLILSLVSLIGLCASSFNNSKTPETRTVSYKKFKLSDEAINEVDSYNITENDERIKIELDRVFCFDDEDIDLVSLEEVDVDVAIVKYEIDYSRSEDTIFFTCDGIKNNEITSLLNSIPALPSYNNDGKADCLVAYNDDVRFLSTIVDLDVINNTGWFDDWWNSVCEGVKSWFNDRIEDCKKFCRTLCKAGQELCQFILGDENAAALGAFFLNMSNDENGIYHANFDCWQQYFGYTDFYDIIFDCGTNMRTKKFEFDTNNDGKEDHIFWAWKGDYLNLGAGAELGIYEKWNSCSKIWKVNKNDALKMTIKLDCKNKGTLFNWQPTQKQWWITGFDYKTQDVERDSLTATFTIRFENSSLYANFKNRYRRNDYCSFPSSLNLKITF